MPTKSIHHETLKMLRTEKARLSQQGLADVSGVSKKTIARIEKNKSSANSTTAKRLAKALGVTPEELAKPFDPSANQEKDLLKFHGYRKVRLSLQGNTLLALQMVEKCYGISQRDQLALAPLLAGLLAEGSLAWRKCRLEELENVPDMLREADFGCNVFNIAGGRAEEAMSNERESIKEREIFGDRVMKYAEQWGVDTDPGSPFVEYLRHFAKESGTEFIKVLPEDYPEADNWMTSKNLPQASVHYSINAAELDRLVGDNEWAGWALRQGFVKIGDIPQELLGNDDLEKRVAWIESQIPQAERDAYDKYWNDLMRDIKIDLFDEETREATNEN